MMICPRDQQPCTYDHSRRCFNECAARVAKQIMVIVEDELDRRKNEDCHLP